MTILVDLNTMLAKRKIKVTELSKGLEITMTNGSILKNRKAKAIKFSILEKICEILEYKNNS